MTASAEVSRRRAERVKAAHALRKRVSVAEIARHLGVSQHTVKGYFRDPGGAKGRRYREKHRGTCLSCGAKTSSPRIERCANCAPNTGPPGLWTREAVIEAIKAWTLTYGEPPACRDWQPSPSDGERLARFRRLRASVVRNRRRGLIPAANTVFRLFGSWNAGIEAAGFTPRHAGGQEQREQRTECSRGHRLDEENTFFDWKGRRKCRKCNRRHQANYRIRKRARERGLILGDPEPEPPPTPKEKAKAGADPRRKWTEEAVVEAIQRFAAEHGRPPLSTEWMKKDRGKDYPHATSVYTHGDHKGAFPSWGDAIEAAGFPRPKGGWPEKPTKEGR